MPKLHALRDRRKSVNAKFRQGIHENSSQREYITHIISRIPSTVHTPYIIGTTVIPIKYISSPAIIIIAFRTDGAEDINNVCSCL